jgi:hypothetical protein
MAEVYWLRLPEHTDMFSEGYVGVTKRTAKSRFYEHVHKSKDSNSYLHNVIRKYGEGSIIVETLVICDIDYAFEVESKLRPEKCIGWNLAAGGYNNGDGRNKSKAEKSLNLSNECIPESDEVNLKSRKGRKVGYRTNKPLPVGVSATTNHKVWSIADYLFEAFQSGLTRQQICDAFGIEKLTNITQICRHFRKGWNPLEDSDWINRYRKDMTNGS